MSNYPEIVIVDDDHEDQLIMLEYFKEVGQERHVKFIDNGQQVLDYLNQIAEDGHVIAFIPTLEQLIKHNGILQPERVGVRRASTFEPEHLSWKDSGAEHNLLEKFFR